MAVQASGERVTGRNREDGSIDKECKDKLGPWTPSEGAWTSSFLLGLEVRNWPSLMLVN